MKHYETMRKLWRDTFIAAFLFTVIYVLASILSGYSGVIDVVIKYGLVLVTFISAVRYFSLIGMEGANYDSTTNISRFEKKKKNEIEKTIKQNPDVFVAPKAQEDPDSGKGQKTGPDIPETLAVEPMAEEYPLAQPIQAVPDTNVEPIVIERPVFREVIKEIIVEKPVYVEKIVEREIIVEKPVIKEVANKSGQQFVVGANDQKKNSNNSKKQDNVDEKKKVVKKEKSPKQNNQLRESLEKIVAEQKERDSKISANQTPSLVGGQGGKDEKTKKHLPALLSDLRAVADPEKKKKQEDFFQAEKGEYAEDDNFLGVKLSDVLKLSEQYKDKLDDGEVKKLLSSEVHEERLCGIWVLIQRYQSTDKSDEKSDIYDFYIKNRKLANNWDLVDLAARNIVGPELFSNNDKDGVLTSFVSAESIWDKRTAVMATTSFLNSGDLSKSFLVSERLADSKEDLIQSSVGWILKEAYKKDADAVEKFLIKHFEELPSQSIRIATEKMEKKKRKEFLKGNFEA